MFMNQNKLRRHVTYLFVALCSMMAHRTKAQSNALDSTRQFIKDNWKNVVHVHTQDSGTLIGLPLPYSVPGSGKNFQEMYYWDTYFTNVGLIKDGLVEQARNNIENMLSLINRYGFMPNGNRTFYLIRSQPPYLSMMIRDVYEVSKDKEWLAKVLPVLEKEYKFWMKERMTTVGLNRYNGMADDNRKRSMFTSADRRLGISKRLPNLTDAEKLTYGAHFIAECESGWDFTPRFDSKCSDYLPVDLNCNLYMYENNFSFFYKELKKKASNQWEHIAADRKTLIHKYLINKKDNLFYDYNYVNGQLSTVLSAAVFNVLWSGVGNADDAKAIVEQLPRLEAAHGIAACEQGPRTASYQWDYPNGWANLQYVAVNGLDKYGYSNDAIRIARKYVQMVANNFSKTHNLWEKYNVSDGSLNATNEYGLPALMGWTAGVYSYCYEYLVDGTKTPIKK